MTITINNWVRVFTLNSTSTQQYSVFLDPSFEFENIFYYARNCVLNLSRMLCSAFFLISCYMWWMHCDSLIALTDVDCAQARVASNADEERTSVTAPVATASSALASIPINHDEVPVSRLHACCVAVWMRRYTVALPDHCMSHAILETISDAQSADGNSFTAFVCSRNPTLSFCGAAAANPNVQPPTVNTVTDEVLRMISICHCAAKHAAHLICPPHRCHQRHRERFH